MLFLLPKMSCPFLLLSRMALIKHLRDYLLQAFLEHLHSQAELEALALCAPLITQLILRTGMTIFVHSPEVYSYYHSSNIRESCTTYVLGLTSLGGKRALLPLEGLL